MTFEVGYYVAAGVAIYLALIFFSPVRLSLRDGWRCLRRYPMLWLILAIFGVCYAAFQAGLQLHYHFVLQGEEAIDLNFSWSLSREKLLEAARESALPAAENGAGIFNNLVTTYPFSALAALLLLVNWQGHHVVLNRALRKRYGIVGWLIYFGIVAFAVAAMVKPAIYILLPELNRTFPDHPVLQFSALVDWLSFIFEYLFGVCIQLYLILLVFMWVRGITFTHAHLLDVAIRRFSSVVKWAAVVLLLSTLFIHLPLMAATLPEESKFFPPQPTFAYIDNVARPLLALFLIMFATMQITLTFHSESLRKAARDHFGFVRRHWWPLSWFILILAVQFWLMYLVHFVVLAGVGTQSVAAIGWKLLFPLFAAFIDGWLLASWVCLFRRCESGQQTADDWVKF